MRSPPRPHPHAPQSAPQFAPQSAGQAGEPTLRLAAFLPYRLSVLANRVSRAIARRYQDEFGLTIPEWRVMAVLADLGQASASDIAEATEMDKVAISRAATRMKAMGRIAARADADDQRRALLSLTADGLAIYRRIVPLALAFEQRLAEALTDRDRDALDRLLAQLSQAARTL